MNQDSVITTSGLFDRFAETEDGWLDSHTGLLWARVGSGTMSWKEAIVIAKSPWRKPWRLPTIREMLSIVDFERYKPATKLPGMLPLEYWSATSFSGGTMYAWYIDMDSGFMGFGDKECAGRYVWLVRDGLSRPD